MKKFTMLLGLGLIASCMAGCSISNSLVFELSEDRTYYSVRSGSKTQSGDIEIPEEHNGLPVRAIANEAFSNRQNITSVKIPNSVVTIGDTAFFGCSGIKELKLSKFITHIGDRAFNDSGIETLLVDEENLAYSSLANILYDKNQTELLYIYKGVESVNLAQTITSINDSLFEGNTKLTSIVIPNGVTSIGEKAFRDCSNLESVTLSNNLLKIGDSAFENCIKLSSATLPLNVTEIGEGAFRNCQKLTTLLLNDSLTEIGAEAFSGCTSLQGNVDNDANFTSTYIGSPSNKYEVLLKVEIKEGATSYDYKMNDGCSLVVEGAFLNADLIETMELSKNLKYFDAYTFNDLLSLFSISISGDNPYYASENDLLFNKEKTEIVYAPFAIEEAIVPEGVLSIGEEFMDHELLSSVELPNSLESVTMGAFSGCPEIKIPVNPKKEYVSKYLGNSENPNLVLIGFRETSEQSYTGGDRTYTFSVANGCKLIAGNVIKSSSLKKVNIPDSVKFIGDSNFTGSANIEYNKISSKGLNAYYLGNQDNPKVALYRVEVDPGYVGEEGSTFTISKDTNIILQNAFLSIPSVTVNVEDGNQAFVYDDGVIYNSAMTKVVYFNSNKTSQFVVPEGYTTLTSEVLSKATNLKSISLPSSFIEFDPEAFANCTSLESFEVNPSNPNFSAYDGILYDKFMTEIVYVPAAIKEIVVPSSVESIALGAFKDCKSLESLTVNYIGGSLQDHNNKFISYLFGSPKVSNMEKAIPESLKKVVILANASDIVNANAFYAHQNIETIVLPDNIVAFGDHAFYDCEDLKEINVPEGVKSIGDWAFFNCKSLKEINLPKALKYVGSHCFRDCEGLETIRFGGTMAEWRAIEFGRDWNSNLKASSVICSNGSVSI